MKAIGINVSNINGFMVKVNHRYLKSACLSKTVALGEYLYVAFCATHTNVSLAKLFQVIDRC